MKNKNYLILGGTSGIGYSIAQKLVELGHRVVIIGKKEDKLINAINRLNTKNSLGYSYDLENINEIYKIFEFCKQEEIILDGMIYCAGISPLCLIKDNKPDLMEKVFDINVFSFLEAVKYFQDKKYSKDGSKIIAISSITAKGAGYRQTLYGASKAALVAAVKLMAKELLNRNIYINAISPGVTNTEMFEELQKNSKNLKEKIESVQPLGIISPEQISEFVIFLLSESVECLTGGEIIVDGGAMLK